MLALAGPPVREEVTEFEPPSRLAYRALSGVPAKHHQGLVELREVGDQTFVNWRLDSTPRLPLPESIYSALVKVAIRPLLRGIAKESERRTQGAA